MIFFTSKTLLARVTTRKLARKLKYDGLSPENCKPLSNNWLKGFLSRYKYLKLKLDNHLYLPRLRKNAENLIWLLFDLYMYYISFYNILPDDIWNLDEAGFRIVELTNKLEILVPDTAPNIISRDSSKLVTVLEMTLKVGSLKNLYSHMRVFIRWQAGFLVSLPKDLIVQCFPQGL